VCLANMSGLLDNGFRVFLVADAISSRTAENARIGVERMRDAGAAIVSAEWSSSRCFRLPGQRNSSKY